METMSEPGPRTVAQSVRTALAPQGLRRSSSWSHHARARTRARTHARAKARARNDMAPSPAATHP
eukprot:10447761-Alexandrium_andersonii.AAC.1